MVDPVTLILTALVVGAGDTGAQVIKDSYAGLKALLMKRFAGDARAELALAEHESDPDTYEKPLGKYLQATGAANDPEVVAAAQQVVQAVNAAGVKIKYQVNIAGGRTAVGDGACYVEHAFGADRSSTVVE